MSYDIEIMVKVEGCNRYARIATPEYSHPTYNLREMFVACMNWNYSQSEKDQTGEYQTCYYPCEFVIQKIENGLKELHTNRMVYKKYNPPNGWGCISSAIEVLESLRACIYECAEEIPLNCLYMKW